MSPVPWPKCPLFSKNNKTSNLLEFLCSYSYEGVNNKSILSDLYKILILTKLRPDFKLWQFILEEEGPNISVKDK